MRRLELGDTGTGAVPWESVLRRPLELLIREDVKTSRLPSYVETFGELGCSARLVSDRDFDLSPDRMVFIPGNALWHELALERIRTRPRDERPGVILWHSEPLPFPRASGRSVERLSAREIAKIVLRDRRVSDVHSNARHLRRVAREDVIDLLAVATQASRTFLAEEGIAAELVPVGYHPVDARLLNLERDISVLFIGDLRVPRRKAVLRRLERDGLAVHAVGSYSDQRYWGESRTELLNRAKILLNIPRHSGLAADLRLILGMATGALVISEPIYLPEPYEPGTHYVEAPIEEMAQTAQRYLADEEARRRITDAAYAFVTEELTLKRSFAKLLTLAAECLGRSAR